MVRSATFLLLERGLKQTSSYVLRPSFQSLFSNQGTMDSQFLASSDFIWGMLLTFPSPAGLLVSSAVGSALLGLMCHVARALLGGDAGNIFETGAERTLSFLAPLPSQLTTCGQHQCFSTSTLLARKGALGKAATKYLPGTTGPSSLPPETGHILFLVWASVFCPLASLSQRPPHSVYALMHCWS